MTATVHDTARSLLATFGALAEWGPTTDLCIHDATPELMALVDTILDLVPAAWRPYSSPFTGSRDDGYVPLYHPEDGPAVNLGVYQRRISVHRVARPPRYVEPDAATADPTAVMAATVAALVGLASGPSEDEDEDDEQIARVVRPGRSRAWI